MKNQCKAERISEREFVVSREVRGRASALFEAWCNPAIFKQWWVPQGAPMTLESCEIDARAGGKYRLEFNFGSEKMAFFGRYLEVNAPTRLVWTNEESGLDHAAITTVSFVEKNGTTWITVHDLYPTKEDLDTAISSGATAGMPVQLQQLEDLIAKGR